MVRSLRRPCLFPIVCLLLAASIRAFGAPTWTDPTPDELKMTTDPAAPDAPAIFLFREETVDDNLHYHRLYARIKILTEKGKQDYSDVEIPYEAGVANVRAVEGRTIHSDGTVIPFSGKPYSKELQKNGEQKIMAKVFSMPDVQVGSILEYRYDLEYEDNWYMPPYWYIQQPVFVRKAHYHFVPLNLAATFKVLTSKDAFGKETVANRLLFYAGLPPGVKVREGMDGYDLAVDNIPPLAHEEFSPPLDSYSYRLIFYYSEASGEVDFWKAEAKVWAKDVDRFANPSDKIRQAVAGIVAPGDTDDQKLRKIYAAVMALENTRFTREHSQAENKAAGLRVKTASDIWEQKRGSDDELARLFISMARAAGFKAYAMAVTERDRNALNPGYLDWGQFEDEIAIVNVGGKDVLFDPGQRYCEYGKLHWMHTQVVGIRQNDNGGGVLETPSAGYQDNPIHRMADLELSGDGTLKGTIRVTMNGADALRWRQEALRSDEEEVKKDFDEVMRREVPDGVQVKTSHFVGLTDSTAGLMVVADVSGSLGTRTGKRVVLPSAFFEARTRPLFAEEKRENPVDLRYPYIAQDSVSLKLAPGLTVESLPNKSEFTMKQAAAYKASYSFKDNAYTQERVLAVGLTRYKKEEYPQLRDFFQKTGAQDQEQLVLKQAAVTATAAGGSGQSE